MLIRASKFSCRIKAKKLKKLIITALALDRKTCSKAVGWGLKQASATFVLTREEEEDWLGCFNYSKLGHVNQFVPEIV